MHNISIKYVYLHRNKICLTKKTRKEEKDPMEYLFLRRKEATVASQRQKILLFETAGKQWEKEFALKRRDGREVDCEIYKNLLYQLEIRKVFLDSKLSLKKLSAMIETNQTYLSNVVNRYFECNLKELVNTYRIEYAKELLHKGCCGLKEIPLRCGFASKSPFYMAFKKMTGVTPLKYMTELRQSS